MKVLFCLVFFLAFAVNAGSYHDAKKRNYRITWKMKTPNEIDTNTVCEQYKIGSLQRRECRQQAQIFFSRKCDATRGDEKFKYCFAAKLHPAR